jgi:O-antigen ligase
MTEVTSNTPELSKVPVLDSRFGLASRFLYADILAASAAAILPWSTTGFAIIFAFWLFALIPLIPTVDFRAFLALLRRPFCLWPLAIILIALIGTLWADAPWQARLAGIRPTAKLLAMPLLIYHFQRSSRGTWIFLAFLLSSALLMVLSCIVLFAPELKLTITASDGVPVKNYIDQSQSFALCMVALAPCIISLYRQRRYLAAGACAALALGFFANMAFVVSARAALIYVPVLLLLFAIRYLNLRQSVLLFGTGMIAAVVVCFSSPYLRARITDIATEYNYYKENVARSTGLRLEYWQKSLRFYSDAPIFGNGTGSTKTLFERDAVGKIGLAAEVTKNPHNQTLNVAVQWGIIGVIALYGMWISHLYLFRENGFVNWIGALVVVQNLCSSAFNSHLFDFHEGWMYVLGVGVAGGMKLAAKPPAGTPAQRLAPSSLA